MTAPDPVALAIYEIKARGYRRGETGDMSSRLSDCAAIDVPRLLAAVERIRALSVRWDAEAADGTPLLDRKIGAHLLRRELAAALLGIEEPDEIEPPRTETDCGPLGGSLNPTPDCGGPRKPPGATELWWCDAHREFHGKEDTDG